MTLRTAVELGYRDFRYMEEDRDLESIRMIAPDVGGGFGPKAPFYAEEAVIPDYPPGCMRILIANDWYPTLLRPDVDVVITEIGGTVGDAVATGTILNDD